MDAPGPAVLTPGLLELSERIEALAAKMPRDDIFVERDEIAVRLLEPKPVRERNPAGHWFCNIPRRRFDLYDVTATTFAIFGMFSGTPASNPGNKANWLDFYKTTWTVAAATQDVRYRDAGGDASGTFFSASADTQWVYLQMYCNATTTIASLLGAASCPAIVEVIDGVTTQRRLLWHIPWVTDHIDKQNIVDLREVCVASHGDTLSVSSPTSMETIMGSLIAAS